MPSSKLRRKVLLNAGVILTAGLSGCGSITKPECLTDWKTDVQLSDENAREMALEAEKSHLESELRDAECLNSWGTDGSVTPKEADAVCRSADGIHVDVVHPYWTSREEDDVLDTASDARYVVNEEETERVGGDAISPCEN